MNDGWSNPSVGVWRHRDGSTILSRTDAFGAQYLLSHAKAPWPVGSGCAYSSLRAAKRAHWKLSGQGQSGSWDALWCLLILGALTLFTFWAMTRVI